MDAKPCSGCHQPVDRIGQRYCKACHAAYMRENRPRHSEFTPEARRKAVSRSYANCYQRRGLLKPEPCEKCGEPKAQKHHDDYDRPLAVRWLCIGCHHEVHRGTTFQPAVS